MLGCLSPGQKLLIVEKNFYWVLSRVLRIFHYKILLISAIVIIAWLKKEKVVQNLGISREVETALKMAGIQIFDLLIRCCYLMLHIGSLCQILILLGTSNCLNTTSTSFSSKAYTLYMPLESFIPSKYYAIQFCMASFELQKGVPKGHARTISFTGGSQITMPEKSNLAFVIKKGWRILAHSEY